MDKRERFLGAMFGLAYGDALSFPALFHRFQHPDIPRKRHQFLWRRNAELDEQGISRMMLPFTHRIAKETLEICPTDDTEWAAFTLTALLECDGAPSAACFLEAWRKHILPAKDRLHTSFSERAAIENLERGLLPPATGDDNPLHYEDCAVARAVPIGLICAGDADRAAQLAEADAQITQAEDGIYAARAMAAAVALLADGADLDAALRRARREFPDDSWIAHLDAVAQDCLGEIEQPADLTILLTARVINSVYSYGSVAPETLPSAFVTATACGGDLHQAVALAAGVAKSADSLPAMVGALCGAVQGWGVVSPLWRGALTTLRGLSLPFLAGADLEDLADRLLEKAGTS
ncbi:MAG: ADP-ribosylglycohydrolase family protein [Anaerolineae bacterium]|nr:ADP-ribosylglycohydrolase family protein [Anaerolineae bacterium]NUQ03689.1 ADP-ribosylglycohydrolase family protein [Anaerolineae bacterium]